MKPILVTSYVCPDLDGIACAIAYCEFLQKNDKNVVVNIIGKPHDEADYILNRFNIEYPEIIENANNFDKVVLLDASDLNVLEGKVDPEKIIEVIDHRKVHGADKFPNAKAQIELVGAAATLIAEKFQEDNVDISKKSAILLCSAIISNTSNFKGSVTTDRDIKAFEYINKIAGLANDFWKELFEAKSDLSGGKLKNRMVGDSASFLIGSVNITIAQIEILGVRKLIDERKQEIIDILATIKQEMHSNHIFLNSTDLEEYKNFFVTDDIEMQKLLEKILGVSFTEFVAEKPSLIMRKQIVPLLKAELEK